jgi:toxin FitB
MNVVDSSGWIEYFQDTDRADLFAQAIEDDFDLIVPTIAIYEVHRKLSQHLSESLVSECLDVMRKGQVIEVCDELAVSAAKLSAKHQLAMADAMMYATARAHKATFWTQDEDYQGLVAVKYFPKLSKPSKQRPSKKTP